MSPSRRHGLLAIALLGAALSAQSQPVADVPRSERAPTENALERLQDTDTALSLTSEGTVLYNQDELKLDGYQYCSQAVALAEKGEFRRSIRAASKALHVGLETANDDLIAKSHRDLAIAYSYAGSLDKAEQFAREALKHTAKDPTMVVGPSYKVIGDVQARQGKYSEAIASYQTALEGSSERYRPLVQSSMVNALILSGDLAQARSQLEAIPVPEEAPLRAQLDRTRARLLLAEKQPAEARAIYTTLAQASTGSDSAYQRFWAYDGVARSDLQLGDKAAAAQAFGQAIDSLDDVRARFRSEEFKMGLFSDVQDVFEDAIDLNSQLGNAETAFDYSERSRARALLDQVRERSKVSAVASATVDLPQLQKQLRSDERVVEFHSLPDRLLAWVVAPDSIREVAYPLKRHELDALVEAFRDAVINGRRSAVDGAAQLGALLIDPLQLQDGQRLIVVPHGPLHYLPFQALRSNGRYLIERHALAVVPSMSIASQLASSGAKVAPNLVAFGNPEIGPEYALPGAEAEVKALAGMFPQSRVYMNTEASKTQFVQVASQAKLLHVAAHAQADRVDPLYSKILLANENGRQNFLEAHEVMNLKLDNLALITLSACESGLGQVGNGDEIQGFPRAFLSAGSSVMIISLWPVADDVTATLMTTLYGELAKGTDVMRAMQVAQLAVLEKQGTSHPFFWAPFNVTGNWRLTVGG